MNRGKIVLITLGFIVLCLAYYCLFPKYEFVSAGTSGVGVFRCNRITGKVEAGALGIKDEVVLMRGGLF